MSLLVLSTLLTTLLATVYLYVKYLFLYWERRGVPFIKPSIPFGNFTPTFKRCRSFGQNLHDLYNSSNEPVVGIYTTLRPALLIRDPKITRDILIKDFQSFWHRGFHYDTNVDPMTDNLFSQSGDKWKDMRTKLSPAFTSGKLKGMVETIVDCGKKLEGCLNEYVRSGKEVEVREIFARFTTNVIASVGFGLDIDCIKNPDDEFREYGKKIFEPYLRNAIRFNMSYVSPYLMKMFGLRFADKDVTEFMTETVRQNLEYREKNNVIRKDFFQLLIQLRNAGKVQDNDDDWATNVTSDQKSLSLNDMAAQAYIFFIAGYESTSTTMSFCLYELARNPDIQQKVYEEIASELQKHNGKLNYESLGEMKYLESCIDETLRLHPPFDFFSRECTKDYKVADSDIVIEKGTSILFSVSGPQYDPTYYDEPLKFRPERFIDDQTANKNSLNKPYLTFGDGPRICIGMRLGKMQTKIGLCLLLRHFSFELGAQHINKELIFNRTAIVRSPTDGINLKVINRCSSS